MKEAILSDIAVSSRIRLARNVNELPFPTIQGDEKLDEIVKPVFHALNKVKLCNIYHMGSISDIDANVLREKHLISYDLMQNKRNGSAVISEDETLSVMVNEEDHIREQCLLSGCNLEEGYRILDRVDDLLSEKIEFAFDERYGYITSCPTNLGTGMRASVMMFLPALTITRKITPIIDKVSRERITVRGVYGEGSSAEGSMYQVSNQVSLGLAEQDILRHVKNTVLRIGEAERVAREELQKYSGLEIKDRVKRAYGILTNAAKIDSKEFMMLFSDVKLGAALGILPFEKPELMEEILVKVQPANITKAAGRELTAEERDVYRADFVANALTAIRG